MPLVSSQERLAALPLIVQAIVAAAQQGDLARNEPPSLVALIASLSAWQPTAQLWWENSSQSGEPRGTGTGTMT